MGSSDLNLLVEMGFDKEKAELAVKKTGSRTYSNHAMHMLTFLSARCNRLA
jgi:hypothetical protein